MAWRNQKGASNLHPTGRVQATKKWIFGFSFQTFGTFDAFRMVVDLGYPQDFGTSWCFRFWSLLPGSDRCDGGSQTAAGPWRGIHWDVGGRFASKIEEKLWDKTISNSMVDQHITQ